MKSKPQTSSNSKSSVNGNYTVWRMCLDLNKILFYADAAGTLHDSTQRTTLHGTDGIIAGEGEGPLRSEPVALGAFIAALNAPASYWVTTRLMGYDRPPSLSTPTRLMPDPPPSRPLRHQRSTAPVNGNRPHNRSDPPPVGTRCPRSPLHEP